MANDISKEIARITTQFMVLDHVPVGLCLLQQDFRVLFWNSCLESWTKINNVQMPLWHYTNRFPWQNNNSTLHCSTKKMLLNFEPLSNSPNPKRTSTIHCFSELLQKLHS